MFRLSPIVLSLSLPLSVSAQIATTITGVVIDGVTEVRLVDVLVKSGHQEVMTGPEGMFSIGLDSRDITLRFQADGYLDAIILVEDTELEVRLFPSAFSETVEGQVGWAREFGILASHHCTLGLANEATPFLRTFD